MKNVTRPIFLVGAPRSGTTLLAAILSSHSKYICGPETHFFELTNRKNRTLAITDKDWPSLAINLLKNLKITGIPVIEAFNLTELKVYDYLSKHKPSERLLIESITKQYALNNNSESWIEKTPNHVKHIKEIFEVIPDARIIHIIRDPRDSSVSMKKLDWTSSSAFENSILINNWLNSLPEKSTFSERIYNIKYEDLLSDFKNQLFLICKFLKIDFEEKMLKYYEEGQNLKTSNERWKGGENQPLMVNNAFKWKNKDTNPENHLIENICYEIIKEHNYDSLLSLKNRKIIFTGNNRAFYSNMNNELYVLAKEFRLYFFFKNHLNLKRIRKEDNLIICVNEIKLIHLATIIKLLIKNKVGLQNVKFRRTKKLIYVPNSSKSNILSLMKILTNYIFEKFCPELDLKKVLSNSNQKNRE